MSRLYPTPFQVQQLGFICRYCAAAPGVWCTTPNDNWASYLHSDRFYQCRGIRSWHAGTDFPRDSAAEQRLVRLIASAGVH